MPNRCDLRTICLFDLGCLELLVVLGASLISRPESGEPTFKEWGGMEVGEGVGMGRWGRGGGVGMRGGGWTVENGVWGMGGAVRGDAGRGSLDV